MGGVTLKEPILIARERGERLVSSVAYAAAQESCYVVTARPEESSSACRAKGRDWRSNSDWLECARGVRCR